MMEKRRNLLCLNDYVRKVYDINGRTATPAGYVSLLLKEAQMNKKMNEIIEKRDCNVTFLPYQ